MLRLGSHLRALETDVSEEGWGYWHDDGEVGEYGMETVQTSHEKINGMAAKLVDAFVGAEDDDVWPGAVNGGSLCRNEEKAVACAG